jgi:hypothetical protein
VAGYEELPRTWQMPLSDSFTAGASLSAHRELCVQLNNKLIEKRLREHGEKKKLIALSLPWNRVTSSVDA